RRRRFVSFQSMQAGAQGGAAGAIRRRQGVEDLVPGDPYERGGPTGPALLFRRAVFWVGGQRPAGGRLPAGRFRLGEPLAVGGVDVVDRPAQRCRLGFPGLHGLFLGGTLVGRGQVDLFWRRRGEERLQAVVVGLREGVELVVVAASAADRH